MSERKKTSSCPSGIRRWRRSDPPQSPPPGGSAIIALGLRQSSINLSLPLFTQGCKWVPDVLDILLLLVTELERKIDSMECNQNREERLLQLTTDYGYGSDSHSLIEIPIAACDYLLRNNNVELAAEICAVTL